MMTAGAVGVDITIKTNGFVIPVGSTTQLLVQYVQTPLRPHQVYPTTVRNDNVSVSYITIGTDFPVGGFYDVAQVISGPGYYFPSPFSRKWVNQALTP
jgi:hypothetical protein